MTARHAAVLAAAALSLAGCAQPPEPVITVTNPDAVLGDTGNIVATTTAPLPQNPAGPAAAFGDGRHRLFDDIQPGTYRTGGSAVADLPVCSWRLLKDDHVIASGSATGPVSIVIEPEYTGVDVNGCLEWRRLP